MPSQRSGSRRGATEFRRKPRVASLEFRGVPHALRPRRNRRTPCVLVSAFVLISLAIVPAFAHGAGPTSAANGVVLLDLRAVVRLARTRSPTLQPTRAAVAGTSDVARAADVALPTPPRVEVQGGPRVQHGSLPVGAEVTVAGWLDFSMGGYGAARRDLSANLAREARAGVAVAEVDAVMRGALAWTDARLALELERIRAEALRDAEELLRVAEVRVRGGRADPGEVALAQAVVGSARAAVLDAEGRRFVAEAELRFFTGLSASTPIKVAGDFEARDRALDVERLVIQGRANQPDVALSLATADRRERAAELTLATGKPFLAIGPLVTHEGTGDWIFQARVAVPLPFVNPQAFEGARARTEALVGRAEVTERRARLEAEIRIALHEREHARAVRDSLRDGALAPARAALDVASKQYVAGKAELAGVLAARRELLDAEQRWAEAVADVWRADVRLSRALGVDPGTELARGGA